MTGARAPRDPVYESATGRRADPQAVTLRRWIHDRYRSDSEPMPGRFLYYEAISAGVISKHDAETVVAYAEDDGDDGRTVTRGDRLWGAALMWVREHGLVPDRWVTDTTRTLTDYTGWSSLDDAVWAAVEVDALDPWGDLPPPILLTESAASAQVLDPEAGRFHIRVGALRGQAGRAFLANVVAPVLREKPGTVVLVVGDLDKAGGDILASAEARLTRFVRRRVDWRHVALTDAQVTEYGLTRVPRVDRRTRPPSHYMVCEAEALGAARLREVVAAELEALLPEPLDSVLARERAEREAWRRRLRRLRDDDDTDTDGDGGDDDRE